MGGLPSCVLAMGIRRGTLTLEWATQLLDMGADASFTTEDSGESLINLVIKHHRTAESLSIVRLLIERGADINHCGQSDYLWDPRARPPIQQALVKGRYDVAHLLLDEPNLSLTALRGGLLWRVAVYARHGTVSSADKLAMVKKLVRIGGAALISTSSSRGCNALHSFCEYPLAYPSAQLAVIAYLINKGGREIVDKKDFSGRTPLHYAARSGCPPVVLRLLLRKGASITAAHPFYLHKEAQGRLLTAYRYYLRCELPVQVSIAAKTALLPGRALASTPLPDGVTDSIECLIGLSSPPTVDIPIGEQPFGCLINLLVNGYLSSAYECIRQTGSTEAMGSRLDDVLQQVRETAKSERGRFDVKPVGCRRVIERAAGGNGWRDGGDTVCSVNMYVHMLVYTLCH
ncbi:unnamed protein product [Vitrella brassicaformis CCMP3155]|uniref:Uncharacterized protein n=1 Tax=Vitrella brassicaformis (strain CCMP3155) TaxID=1169540 RepID=A0A0G4G248_VITBC|nr:unnamed protein product [Vitrella brassicaformis CCMP3155]|eukprot:CEM22055.1 unnamed protein product [Vitrella brassicaformis CCMP3155]